MTRRAHGEDDDLAGLDAPTGLEVRGSSQPYIQLSFQLPSSYVRVLDGEAELLSQRRSTLLDLLVLRKSGGVIKLERSPDAPKYRMDRRDLHIMHRYVWHCRPEIKRRLDDLRERMGNIPARSWVILALNEWIGLPAGVGDLDGEVPKQPTLERKKSSHTQRVHPKNR